VTALRRLHRTGRPCLRGHGLAVWDMPDARLYAWQGAKDMPHAWPARSGLAKTSRRRTPPASGGVHRSHPLAQQALEQVISQTEGVISFRHIMLRARCRHGRLERDHCSGGAFASVCGASRHPCWQCVAAR